MNCLNVQEIKEIQRLRKQGIGYKTIAKSLVLSPSTVYKYSQNVKLSKESKLKLIENQLNREFNFAQKFAKEKEILKPKLDEKLASVLGHLFFDGSVPNNYDGKFALNYTNSSLESVEDFIKNMGVCFHLKPQKVWKADGKNIAWYAVCFLSKKAWNFVKSFSNSFSTKKEVGIPKQIKNSVPKIKRSFLQSFWDDEGCISHNGILSGVSKSKRMIDDLFEMHTSLGINCSKWWNKKQNTHILRIKTNLDDFLIFSKKVGFKHGKVSKGHNLGKFKKTVLQIIITTKWARSSVW